MIEYVEKDIIGEIQFRKLQREEDMEKFIETFMVDYNEKGYI